MNKRYYLVSVLMLSSLLTFGQAFAQDSPAVAQQPAVAAANAQSDIIVLPAPNFKGATLKRDKSVKQVKLKQASKVQDESFDDNAWFTENQLRLSELIYTVEPYIPRAAPDSYRKSEPIPALMTYHEIPLMHVFESGGMQIYAYGDVYYHVLNLQIVKDGKVTHRLDFSNFTNRTTQYINWAIIENDILYVQHTGNGYAKGFKGQTSYLSAISLKDNKILWTTKPLTANSRNFILSGNSIIVGYGFTDEPDFLYVIDKFSGERVQTIKLKNGPDFIAERDGQIYVKTYNQRYVFDIK